MSTKQTLMENYLTMGMKNGFDNISLQNIADLVGIKKASVFTHFKDFNDLKNQSLQLCLDDLASKQFEINPKAKDAEELFFELINSFIDAFSAHPENALLYWIEQKKSFDSQFIQLSNKIDLMINSRFQVALDFCYQRSWTNLENTDEVSKLLATYLRNLLVKPNLSDDDLSDMLSTILHLL